MAASMEESNALDGLEDVDNPTQAEAASERRGSSLTMEDLTSLSRRQKRKELKKMRRKEHRQQIAKEVRRMEQMMLQDPVEQLKMRLREQEEAEAREKEQLQHEEEEKLWLQKEKEAQEVAERRRLLEEEEKKRQKEINSKKLEEEEQWEYVEEGPAEVIWQGNEIIVRKQRVRVPKGFQSSANPLDDLNRPTSNPLPPQSTVFAEHNKLLAVNSMSNAYDGIDNTPNFGTEQDKTHCPFHIKTGVCRFGIRCSRVHVDVSYDSLLWELDCTSYFVIGDLQGKRNPSILLVS